MTTAASGIARSRPKKSANLGADDQSQNDHNGRHSHDFSHHQRIDQVIFKLLNDDI